MTTKQLLINAVKVKSELSLLSSADKNKALEAMAEALLAAEKEILKANAADTEAAKGKISDVMIDRLALTSVRIADMAKGIREVAALPDPVGRVLHSHTLENGLEIRKVSVPIGVVAIIYESRPNVTSDAAALCLKSGNVCVLRWGERSLSNLFGNCSC